MYDYIHGKLVQKKATKAVIDVQGLGYILRISLSTSQSLPDEGETVTLKTYLHVREDILQLYGFAGDEEREIFIGLLSISGIGPKLAQTILSGLSPEKIVSAIRANDEKTLFSISGVGKKTAQRLIVELKDKFSKYSLAGKTEEPPGERHFGTLEDEAVMALISLGYSRQRADNAIIKIHKKGQRILTAEELIKEALQVI